MSLIDAFFPKKRQLITQEDSDKLRELERTAYMEEAEKIIRERGKRRAKFELERPIN